MNVHCNCLTRFNGWKHNAVLDFTSTLHLSESTKLVNFICQNLNSHIAITILKKGYHIQIVQTPWQTNSFPQAHTKIQSAVVGMNMRPPSVHIDIVNIARPSYMPRLCTLSVHSVFICIIKHENTSPASLSSISVNCVFYLLIADFNTDPDNTIFLLWPLRCGVIKSALF